MSRKRGEEKTRKKKEKIENLSWRHSHQKLNIVGKKKKLILNKKGGNFMSILEIKEELLKDDVYTLGEAYLFNNIEDMESANLFLEKIEENDEFIDWVEDTYSGFKEFAAFIRKPYTKRTLEEEGEDYIGQEYSISSEGTSEYDSVNESDESVEDFELNPKYKDNRKRIREINRELDAAQIKTTVLEEEKRQLKLTLFNHRSESKGIFRKKQKNRTTKNSGVLD